MRDSLSLCSCALILTVLSVADGAVEYYGKFIAPLSSYHHGVSGDVFAVDAKTLHIRNFNYDGEGPAAYFYVGNSKSVNGNGHRLLSERGLPHPLKRYNNKHITLTLPEGKTLSNVKWFAIWCDEAAVNFGDVKIAKGLDFPKPQKLAALNGVHAVSSEPIVVVDAQTLLIPSFSYDGEAPDAKFWTGQGSRPSPQGIRIPDENGKEVPLRRYDRKTIVLTLPGDLTVFDIGHFGIWCEAFTVDFGHIQVPAGLNVPPSLKMLGVAPQKRSRSLELSALQSSQQLLQKPNTKPQRTRNNDKSENNSFNYHNVLPLFNVQETIRPTTYRPQLLVQPTTIDPKTLEGADHRFSQKHTNGYLPLHQFGQPIAQPQYIQHVQVQQPIQRQFTPTVQIVPSISLNDDNGLINRAHFDLGPPLHQQFAVDPAFLNQQLQYDQYGNIVQTQPQFLINVQEDQVAYQRPIRKESTSPPAENRVPKKENVAQTLKATTKAQPSTKPAKIQDQQNLNSQQKRIEQTVVQSVPSQQLQPESFSIPIIPISSAITISPAVLAEEFEQSSLGIQPQVRQATVPDLAEVLTVPIKFVDNGVFSTNFGKVERLPIIPAVRPTKQPSSFRSSTTQPARPVSRLRAFTPQTSVIRNNRPTPDGSFSSFVLNTKSGTFDTFVRY